MLVMKSLNLKGTLLQVAATGKSRFINVKLTVNL